MWLFICKDYCKGLLVSNYWRCAHAVAVVCYAFLGACCLFCFCLTHPFLWRWCNRYHGYLLPIASFANGLIFCVASVLQSSIDKLKFWESTFFHGCHSNWRKTTKYCKLNACSFHQDNAKWRDKKKFHHVCVSCLSEEWVHPWLKISFYNFWLTFILSSGKWLNLWTGHGFSCVNRCSWS